MDDKRIDIPATEARQATQEGVSRYVLGVSLALVIVGFAVLWFVVFA